MDTLSRIDAFKLIGAPVSGRATERLEVKARQRFVVAQALAQGRVEFHYQPVVQAGRTGFVAFYETLVRMRQTDGTTIAAGKFLPAVEQTLLGRAIDRLALSHALHALAARPTLRLAVNMSPLSMGDAEWLEILAQAHEEMPDACGRLIVEITEETAMRDVGQTIDFMDHVRACGCAFALDDFGAGATGFRYFRDFRFDIVKIDGSFVHGIHAARDAQVLVECLAAVARHFEMMTVAEQVETEADAEWLRKLGIDCLQGYLYGRPSPVAELPRATAEAARAAG